MMDLDLGIYRFDRYFGVMGHSPQEFFLNMFRYVSGILANITTLMTMIFCCCLPQFSLKGYKYKYVKIYLFLLLLWSNVLLSRE